MNARELATVIWLGIALIACLRSDDIRQALWQVVKSFCDPKVLGPVLALAAWTVGLVVLADRVGWWAPDLRNVAVIWFATVGIGFYFSLGKVTEHGFFRATVRRSLAATVFVEGFVNLAVFPFPVEFLLVPLTAFVAVMSAFSEGKQEYAPVHRLASCFMSLLGLGFIAYVGVRLAADLDAGHTVRALALPIWLTVGVAPLIYLVGLWAAYEQAFIRIDFRTDDSASRRRAKRALVRTANVHAADLGGFSGHWIFDLASSESDQAARALMRRWRRTWRAERRDDRMRDAAAHLSHWLEQSDPALAEICEDAVHRCWEALDSEQRAMLKREGFELAASDQDAERIGLLPD